MSKAFDMYFWGHFGPMSKTFDRQKEGGAVR